MYPIIRFPPSHMPSRMIQSCTHSKLLTLKEDESMVELYMFIPSKPTCVAFCMDISKILTLLTCSKNMLALNIAISSRTDPISIKYSKNRKISLDSTIAKGSELHPVMVKPFKVRSATSRNMKPPMELSHSMITVDCIIVS